MTGDLFAAFLMGLAGAGHCLAMCGGIAGALGHNASTVRLVTYNFGRITSYAIAGALIGSASVSLALITPDYLIYLRVLAAFFLIAIGLYLGGWWLGITRLEKLGLPLWRQLQPYATRFRTNQSLAGTYVAGMLWGWLPCGLVYSALSWAALQGSFADGALTMVLFGLGTFPAMVLIGYFSRALLSIVRSQGFRKAMGILFIGYGLWTGMLLLH